MKFNTAIIGGGLSGLVSGIELQKAGIKTAIISAGQNAMTFSSGTLNLLNRLPSGEEVTKPIEAISKLPENHPYSKIGIERINRYVNSIKPLFGGCGIDLQGDINNNSYNISPTGEITPCWLTFDELTPLKSKNEILGNNALIVNILGFLDFNTKFIASRLEKQGTKCRIISLKLPETERLRKNPTEMRSTNIARVMERENTWEKFVISILEQRINEDLIILPSLFDINKAYICNKIRAEINTKVIFVPTMPPSIPGLRSQIRLQKEYIKLGGEFFKGDTVTNAEIRDNKVINIYTSNFENIPIQAENYILASGSFFSKGLIADPYRVYEPIFGLDIDYDEKRDNWYNTKFFSKQNYIGYGVSTNGRLQPSINGSIIENLYGCGSILSGANTLYEGSGAGVAILTALYAAEQIIGK